MGRRRRLALALLAPLSACGAPAAPAPALAPGPAIADPAPAPRAPQVAAAPDVAALARALEREDDPATRLELTVALSDREDRAALPALRGAIASERAGDEEARLTAARALASDALRGELAAGDAELAAAAYGRIEGARGIDNRLRIALLRLLDAIEGPAAIDALSTIARRRAEGHSFLLNRLAFEGLARRADPRAVGVLLEGLLTFEPGAPHMRANDVAAGGLSAIGPPAIDPLLDALDGGNPRVNELAREYVDAVRRVDPRAAAGLDPERVIVVETLYALGEVGDPRVLGRMLAEAAHRDGWRRHGGAVALARLSLSPADRPHARRAIEGAARRASGPAARAHLVALIGRLADLEALPFLLSMVRDRRADPDARYGALQSHAMLADAAAARALRGAGSEPLLEAPLQDLSSVLDAAERCDRDPACWLALLDDPSAVLVDKACRMLAALDARDAVERLVPLLSSPELSVRQGALHAIDRLAVDGSALAVEALDELSRREEGRAIWSAFRQEAIATRGRLVARARR